MISLNDRKNLTRFGCSGLSCMSAACFTNPIDVIKVRLQLDNQLVKKKNIFVDRYYQGFLRGVILIAKEEGISGLYKGVGASILREGVYSTIRLGAYEPVKELLGASKSNSALWKKVIAGAITGTCGSVIATPTDLVKIRLQGEGKLKPGELPRYMNTFHAFKTIVTNEGVVALWRGVGPTVQRAALVSASQIPTYDHVKNVIKHKQIIREGFMLHLVSALTAGLVTSLVTSPIDVVKTRTMEEKLTFNHKIVYTSTFSSLRMIVKSEGIFGLYKGFVPNWLRTGPHTMITFMLFEQLRKITGLDPV